MTQSMGLISLGFTNFRVDIAQSYLDKTKQALALEKLVCIEKVVVDGTMLDEAIKVLKTNQIEGIIIQFGTFCMGDLMVKLCQSFKHIPIILVGFEEPTIESYKSIVLNSLTAFNMATSFLKRLDIQFDYVYGAPDEKMMQYLATSIHAAKVYQQFSQDKIAVIGTRAPGFYLCEVDQLALQKTLGVEIEYIGVGTLVEMAKQIDPQRVEDAVASVYQTKTVTVGANMVNKTIRLELALLDIKASSNITAFSFECWPEIQTLYGCSVCGVISRLTDQGIMVSCEGDVTGLLTMMIQHRLTQGAIPFFADLVNISQQGILKAWHCGQGPASLAVGEVSYCEHPTMKQNLGVSVSYEMKQGVITMNKLSQYQGKLRMLSVYGKSVPVDKEIEGTQSDIKLDVPLKALLSIIVEEGIEHHYSIVHQAIKKQLKAFCKWANIRMIEVNNDE